MPDNNITIEQLKTKVVKFIRERDWEKISHILRILACPQPQKQLSLWKNFNGLTLKNIDDNERQEN